VGGGGKGGRSYGRLIDGNESRSSYSGRKGKENRLPKSGARKGQRLAPEKNQKKAETGTEILERWVSWRKEIWSRRILASKNASEGGRNLGRGGIRGFQRCG